MSDADTLERVLAAPDPAAEVRSLSDPELLAAERALPLGPGDPASRAILSEIKRRELDV